MDIDQLSRAMKDLEYRVKQVERTQRIMINLAEAAEKVASVPEGYVAGDWKPSPAPAKSKPVLRVVADEASQFCSCGRDVCRAPDCPSHKPDPMGR